MKITIIKYRIILSAVHQLTTGEETSLTLPCTLIDRSHSNFDVPGKLLLLLAVKRRGSKDLRRGLKDLRRGSKDLRRGRRI